MKNKYNALVVILMLVCLADAGHRLYKIYKKYTTPQSKELIK